MKGSRHLSPIFELQLSPNPEGCVAPGSGAASAQLIGEWGVDAMFVGDPSLSLCMLSTMLGGVAEVRASGPGVWSLLEGVAWAGSLSQERGDRLFWTKRESPRLEELCLLAASASQGWGRPGGAEPESPVDKGITVYPTVALGPQLEILGPCHGWEGPAWPGVLPPQAPGRRLCWPTLLPTPSPKHGR